MPIDHSDVGAWVVRANPAMWDVHGARDAGEVVTRYRLGNTYRNELITPGDAVWLWANAGSNAAARRRSGFVAFGQVTGFPDEDQGGGDHWIDEDEAGKVRDYVEVDLPWLEAPVLRSELQRLPWFEQLEFILAPQIGNPSYLTPKEHDLVSGLLA